MVQWYNPVILQPEQSGGMGTIPGRAPSLLRHDKGSQTVSLNLICDDAMNAP